MVVQTTQNDVIFLGHGSYQGGGKEQFQLPDNVDLYLLQPIGAKLRVSLACNLIQQKPIKKLTFHRDGSPDSDISKDFPIVFKGGATMPDLILHDLGSLRESLTNLLPQGPHHTILVSEDTTLSALLGRSDVMMQLDILPRSKTKLKIILLHNFTNITQLIYVYDSTSNSRPNHICFTFRTLFINPHN